MHLRMAGIGLVVVLATGCAQVPIGESGPTPDAERVQGAPVQATEPVATPAIAAAAAQAPANPPIVAPAAAAAPPPPVTLWERVRGRFQVANLEGPLVREWEQWYSSRPDYVARMIERSSY